MNNKQAIELLPRVQPRVVAPVTIEPDLAGRIKLQRMRDQARLIEFRAAMQAIMRKHTHARMLSYYQTPEKGA